MYHGYWIIVNEWMDEQMNELDMFIKNLILDKMWYVFFS